jgi:predicted  nucleic acid-binding Zn-ribbon protein
MDCEDEINDLEEQVEELEKEVEELESQLMEFETNSLDDEYKFKYFNEYKSDFTPWELEILLKNGRQFLNENPLHK